MDELEREIELIKVDNIHRLTDAYKNIEKCTDKNYMASAITITIKNINQKNFIVCEEFSIADGLSPETVEAIKRDIKRTYDLKMSFIKKI